MVITQKITCMAFEIHDGKTSVFFPVCVCVCVSVCVCGNKSARRERSENAASILLGVQKQITWPRF